MRYAYLISRNLALLDLPAEKSGQVKTQKSQKSYFLERIFRQLLVYDQLPDNDLESVLRETNFTLGMADPAFDPVSSVKFTQLVNLEKHRYTWGKTRKDYNAYIRAETKRRNQENPYFNSHPDRIESWDDLPNFSNIKRNQPWQFDSLYRDSQTLSSQIFDILSIFPEHGDRDLFRAKVNGILVPEKIIFALNSNEANLNFSENAMILANLKLSLDGYKQAHVFLNRVIESLHKIRFNHSKHAETLDRAIAFAERIQEKLKLRVTEIERRFLLFLEAIEQENQDDEF